MYENTGKPSLAKFRARLTVIKKASQSGKVLAERWNPKGRHFYVQRKMIQHFEEANKTASKLLEIIDR